MTTAFEKPTSDQRRLTSRNVLHSIRRLGCGVGDQRISSPSNFGLGLFVARPFGASTVGDSRLRLRARPSSAPSRNGPCPIQYGRSPGLEPTAICPRDTSSGMSAIAVHRGSGPFVLGAVAGLSAVGYVRRIGDFDGTVPGGPDVPEPGGRAGGVAGLPQQQARPMNGFCLALGGSQAAGAPLWGVILLVTFPLGIGPYIPGDVWAPTVQLISPIALAVVAAPFIAGLRAMGLARHSLRAQPIASPAYVGAILGGALRSSWGLTHAQFFPALVWGHQLCSALADHRSVAAVES